MMAHFLDGQRRGGHESEGVDEVGEFIFLVQFAVDNGPSVETGKGVFQLRAGESSHAFIIAPRFMDSFRDVP